MRDRRPVDELSVEELERILAVKKREARQNQMARMKRSGRVVPAAQDTDRAAKIKKPLPSFDNPINTIEKAVEDAAIAEPVPIKTEPGPPSIKSTSIPHFEDEPGDVAYPTEKGAGDTDETWRNFVNILLLFVEVAAVVGLVVISINLLLAISNLEDETKAAQEITNATQMAAIPTLEPTPVLRFDQIVLPSGHTFTDNGTADFNYDEIPEHLLPYVQQEMAKQVIVRPPPTDETPIRVTIPALELDVSITQGTDWDALRLGVGQLLNGATPVDSTGNIVLSAHNDIYGELFRQLDQLVAGDQIIIQTKTRTYTYVITHSEQVNPTDVYVMDSKGRPTITLISCYPYRVNNKRIIVYATRLDT